jgi:hypothetical protein
MITAELSADRSRVTTDREGRPRTRVTHMIGAQGKAIPGPQSFLVECLAAETVVKPHFHQVDQFQLFPSGDGHIGRNKVKPTFIHYADAYVTYGPIVSGPLGFRYMTIRATGDPGPQYMPEARDKRKRTTGRHLELHIPDPEAGTCLAVEAPHPDGLAVFVSRFGPGELVGWPEAKHWIGAHGVVLDGSVVAADREYPQLSNFFAVPDESSVPVGTAGASGCRFVSLYFPRPREDDSPA